MTRHKRQDETKDKTRQTTRDERRQGKARQYQAREDKQDMVVVVAIAKALHLLHVVTKVHKSFFMIGCNVVKQLHIQTERQVTTLIDFEVKTKTKTGISTNKSTNKNTRKC
jgi:hypothetical protein